MLLKIRRSTKLNAERISYARFFSEEKKGAFVRKTPIKERKFLLHFSRICGLLATTEKYDYVVAERVSGRKYPYTYWAFCFALFFKVCMTLVFFLLLSNSFLKNNFLLIFNSKSSFKTKRSLTSSRNNFPPQSVLLRHNLEAQK